LTIFVTIFFHFCGGSQLWKQILWIKFHIRCAYFTPNRTWSTNYSVLVNDVATFLSGKAAKATFRENVFINDRLMVCEETESNDVL
jgi:hypothetical protein